MPKQRKLYTLDYDVVEKLAHIAATWDTSNSGAIEALVKQAHRALTERIGAEELCTMVYDAKASEVRFEDAAGGTLAIFHLSSN